jgi:NitT/TauT family transport system substrate-binding protein
MTGVLAGVALVPGTAAQDLTPVTILTPFGGTAIGFFPPYVADALGYFEEEGIDATVEGADGSSFVVGQVAADAAEYGIATTDPVLLGYSTSPTFELVYDLLTGNVFDLWTPSDSGITSLADLKDKIVAVKDLQGGEIPGLEVALTKAGLTPGSDVTLQPVGEEPAIQAETLRNGTAAAFMVSWNSLIGVRDALAAEGIELSCLTCDASTALGSEGIVAPSSLVAENPDLIAGLGRALAKATLFGQTNPEAALAILKSFNEGEQADPAYASKYFDAALEIMDPREPDRLYGWIDPEAWARSMELLQDPSIPSGLTGPVDLEALINNDFVEEYNDFDHEAVIEQATNYEMAQ